jgi:hypothetical protein
MDRFADICPPNSKNASRDTVGDAELLLQSFMMNVFGAIDNLVWVWALERDVKSPNGNELPRTEIVFDGPRAKTLRSSLTPALKTNIDDSKGWFEALRTYRDGVAHQIPIYIPRLLNRDEFEEAERLSKGMDEAIAKSHSRRLFELMDKRHNLGDYGALMALSGEHVTFVLHPQMVCDLAIAVNLGETMFSELSRLTGQV